MTIKNLKFKKLLKVAGLLIIITGFILESASAQDTASDVVRNSRQDFNLFESVDSGSSADRLQNLPRGRRQNNSRSTEPEFTLIGTSRIGSKTSVILRNKDGSEVIVNTSVNTNTRIDGYSQFSIVNINSGKVAIQYPESTSCVESQDKGVSCNSAANIASLELINSAPLQRANSRASRTGDGRGRDSNRDPDLANLIVNEEASDSEVIVSTDEEEPPPNPFAALRARAQAGGSNSQAVTSDSLQRQGFTPRRIDPADVPAGMRIVPTPFGDRLVEQ